MKVCAHRRALILRDSLKLDMFPRQFYLVPNWVPVGSELNFAMFRGKIMFAWGILVFFFVLELTSTQKTKLPSVRFLFVLRVQSQWLSRDWEVDRELTSCQRQRILLSGRKICAASQIEHLNNFSLNQFSKFVIRNPPQFYLVFFYLRQLLFGAIILIWT